MTQEFKARLVYVFKNWKLLFKNFCGNTCGWKSVLKYVKCCLKTENCCLKTLTKHPLSGTKITFSSLKCGLGLLLYCCEIICLCKIKEQRQKKYNNTFRPCLLKLLNNLFLIFKQYYTLFHTHFYPHVFQKTTSNIIQTLLQNGPILLQKSNSKYILSSRLHK